MKTVKKLEVKLNFEAEMQKKWDKISKQIKKLDKLHITRGGNICMR